MALTKVWIEDGCIGCKLCEDTCPAVFEIVDDRAIIKEGADLNANEDAIKESASNCPVEVIKSE